MCLISSQQTVTHGPSQTMRLLLKFYWKTATPSGCFHVKMAELNRYDRD